jgi:hypothetical protein
MFGTASGDRRRVPDPSSKQPLSRVTASVVYRSMADVIALDFVLSLLLGSVNRVSFEENIRRREYST